MKLLTFTFLAVLLLSVSASGQDGHTIKLTGVVYDINGAVVVNGLEVTARNDKGVAYKTGTDDYGIYKFDLPLGVYQVEAWAPGFCSAHAKDFKVVNSTHGKMSLDFVLEVLGVGCPHKHEIEIYRKPRKKNRPVAE